MRQLIDLLLNMKEDYRYIELRVIKARSTVYSLYFTELPFSNSAFRNPTFAFKYLFQFSAFRIPTSAFVQPLPYATFPNGNLIVNTAPPSGEFLAVIVP